MSLYGVDFRDDRVDRRRTPRDQKATPEIKNLWQRHHEIINLHAQGFKNIEIARILNISPVTVSNTINAEVAEEKISELREARDGETRIKVERIRVLTDRALDTYDEILNDESGMATLRDRKEVATAVLFELSGLRVPTKVHSTHAHLTSEDLEEFKRRGIETARASGLIAQESVIEAESSTVGDQGED